ncbi:hypothetical protein B7C42_08370 [Nocardia cerradoensis]|uniref:Uncharacterized protein n=1 Tax=Nocardia cerradoensis TaxID=85688 RepID=A0A231GSI7_9NOCA|nr:hypothetical protein B7C42_08370 [Nocardia cerradoensis]
MLTTISVQVAERYAENNPTVDNVVARAAIHSYDIAFYVGAGFFLLAVVIVALMIRDKPENLIEGSEHVAVAV